MRFTNLPDLPHQPTDGVNPRYIRKPSNWNRNSIGILLCKTNIPNLHCHG